MRDQHLGLRSRILAVVLLGAMVLGLGFSQLKQPSGPDVAWELPPASSGAGVVLNWYAMGDGQDERVNGYRLLDGAVFIAAALPCRVSARPPCFDRGSVVDELIRAGADLSDQYEMTNLEQVGGYVTGRIDILPR